jgi:hypothetical protein
MSSVKLTGNAPTAEVGANQNRERLVGHTSINPAEARIESGNGSVVTRELSPSTSRTPFPVLKGTSPTWRLPAHVDCFRVAEVRELTLSTQVLRTSCFEPLARLLL